MPQTPPPQPRTHSAEPPTRFIFALLDGFSLIAFSGAVDALRLANRIAGRQLYAWQITGEGGDCVRCSNGARIALDGDLPETQRGDTIMLCGGVDVSAAASKRVTGWLRRESRRAARIGALCTAARLLAEAGLLEGRRTTVHWENYDGMIEDFPDTEISRAVFVIDGNRLSAAGGTASIDLMLSLIAAEHGDALATEIADQLIHTGIRTDQDSQRLSIPTRIGVRHPRLAEVIAQMESHIEDPVSPADLAEGAGMSTRQLERLFRRYLNRSPKRYYMETRLARARALLLQTEMSVIEVALACGFSSPSHFSKCYRAQYGATPYRERGTGGTRDVTAFIGRPT